MLDSFITPTRQNKTQGAYRRLKHKSLFNGSLFVGNIRPYTTSICRKQQHYAYRSIDNAEQQLSQTCGKQLNNYVAKEIKCLTNKHKQTLFFRQNFKPNSTLFSTIQTKLYMSQPKTIKQMKLCHLINPKQSKTQNVLGQPFFVNAKQKLVRMIARKKDMQKQFQTVHEKVEEVEKVRLIKKRVKDRLFKNPQSISNSQWSNQWLNESAKQVARYRSRLSTKHKKHTSGLTIQW